MKTNFLTNLKLGSVELERSFELADLESHNLDSHLIDTYGFVIKDDSNFALEDDWKANNLSTLTFDINPGIAILKDTNGIPRPVELTAIKQLTLSSADETYTVTVKYNADSTEEGTVDVVNGSPNVSGTGTKFTKIFGPNRRLIVNNTAYLIQSVTTDTALVLDSNFPDVSTENLEFKVGGWFTSYPGGIADNLIYEHNALTFTVRDSGGGSPGSDEFLITEIDVAGSGISEIRDIRDQNLFKLFSYDLISSVNGTYAKTTQPHTEASDPIRVGDGQARNFPVSVADFSTVFVVHNAGIKAFKYTSRDADNFYGITFSAGTFTSDSGNHVFHSGSVVMDNEKIIIGAFGIKFMPTLDVSDDSAILNLPYIQIGGRTHIKGDTLVIGENAQGESTWEEQQAIIFKRDSTGLGLLKYSFVEGGTPNEAGILRIELDGVGDSLGGSKIHLAINGVDIFTVTETGASAIGAGGCTGPLAADSIYSTQYIQTPGYLKAGSYRNTDQTRQILWGAGTPEGAVTAGTGSIYMRTDGGANTTMYVKESGAGSTGWRAV